MLIKGEKVRVNGTIKYGQDFSYWEGDFPGIVFTVVDVLDNMVCLMAPGYGEIKGNYGNGAIHVRKPFFSQLLRLGQTVPEHELENECLSVHRKVQWKKP